MKLVDEGIFIHRIAYSESSVVATYFTRAHGMQTFIFQGAKKKGGNFFILQPAELEYYRRPDSELGKLTKAQSINQFPELINQPEKTIVAYFIADVIRNCIQTEQEDIAMYTFLIDFMYRLSETDAISVFPILFLLEFTEYLGIEPAWPEQVQNYFQLEHGTFSNLEHRGEIEYHGEGVHFLQELRASRNKTVPQSTKKEALRILLHYYKIHIPKFSPDRTLEILKEIME